MSIPIEDVWAGKVDLTDVVDPDAPRLGPVHPGEILLEEFMKPLGLSARALAAALGVPANRVTQIISGRRSISAGTALRLGRYFGTSPQLWLNLQTTYELHRALDDEGEAVQREVSPRAEAA
jgi:addiction module HigA family antidote